MGIQDDIARARAKYGQDPRLNAPKSLVEEVAGIPGDALWGMASLVGIEPPVEQVIREQRYPVTSFLGSMVGFGGPYLAAFKATEKIDTLNKAIKKIDLFGGVAKAPVKTAMVDAAARTGTVELARLGLNAAVPGGQELGDMALESLLNVGIGAGVTGVVGGLAQGGVRNAPLQEIFKDIDMAAPPQVQQRQLSQALAENRIDPKFLNEARNRLAKLSDNVRTQTATNNTVYVGETLKDAGKRLNRIFASEDKKPSGIVRRRFARTGDGFKNDALWQAAVRSAGLPDDWTKYSQFPRHISFKHEKSAQRIQNTVHHTMQSAGDGWYITREVNDGLFVMAKRIKGKAMSPAKDDEWFFTKTDRPGAFLPDHQAWNNAVADHMLFMARPPKPKGPVNDIYDSARGMQETMPLRRLVDSKAMSGSLGEFGEKIGKALGLDGARLPTGEMTKRVKDFFVEHLAPTVQQFGRNPRAGRAFAIARSTYDAAESVMRKIVYGETNLDPTKTPFSHVLGLKPPASPTPSIKSVADKLSDSDVQEFWQIVKAQTPFKDVEEMWAQGKISDNTREFAKLLDDIDRDISGQTIRVEAATGGGKFEPREGHYMMSHRWDGDNRVALRDAEGKLVAVAAGGSRVGAQRAANSMLGQLEKEGLTGLRIAEEFDITSTVKLPRDLQMQVNSPAWVLERQNVRGFKYDDVPFTKKELLDELGLNVTKRTKYMADRTVQDVLADDIARVAVEDPVMHKILVGRLADLAGQRTPLAKIMDATVDSVLGPVLGKNTASKIVASTNKLMWHLELGGLRVAYPVMNMLTFIQTTMPEIAFVRTANADVLGKYYDVFTARGAQARPGGVLSPMKLMYQGTKQMGSKDPQWMKAVEKGLNEGIVDPRFIEESTGAILDKAKQGFVGALEAISEYMPAQSEKFSRLQSLGTGWVVAKDLLLKKGPKELLTPEEEDIAYHFAKQFTDRTMFRYGMDARPRLFTTPAGSALGLFKNWMMHYVGTMLDYAGEGVKRGNWAPLLWQTAGTGVVGGATALPLWAVANQFSNAMTGKSFLVNGYDWMEPAGDTVSDAVFFGLPSLLGLSLSSNAAAPFSNPMRDVTQFMSLVHMDRAAAAGKFFQGAMDTYSTTGQSPLTDPNTRDMFFRAFAPKTVYRTMATLEDGVINSLSTGNPVMKNVGPMEKIWFSMGFNPVQVEKAYAVSDELWKDQAANRAAVQRYGEAMAHAYERQDLKLMDQIVMRATIEGVDISSIERSAMSRLSKAEADVITRQFKPEDIEERLAVMGDSYEQAYKKGLEEE